MFSICFIIFHLQPSMFLPASSLLFYSLLANLYLLVITQSTLEVFLRVPSFQKSADSHPLVANGQEIGISPCIYIFERIWAKVKFQENILYFILSWPSSSLYFKTSTSFTDTEVNHTSQEKCIFYLLDF